MYVTFKQGIVTIREKVGKKFSRNALDSGSSWIDDENIVASPTEVAKYFRKRSGYAIGVADATRAAYKEFSKFEKSTADMAKELYLLSLNRTTITADKVVETLDRWYRRTKGKTRRGKGKPPAYQYPPEDL